MNPADERIRELLDKWLTSLELHLEYVTLDEEAYRKAQPWPEHDRPSRWIIEVARGKAQELRDQIDSRIKMGDAKFAEALELMAFLVNLVGARVDRFIPLAQAPAGSEDDDDPTGTEPVLAEPEPQPVAPPAAAKPEPAPVVKLPPIPPESPIVRVVAVAPTRSAPPVDETTVVRGTDSGQQRALKAAVEATREMPRPALKAPDPDDTVETPRAKPDSRKATRREAKSKSEARAHAERAPSSKDTGKDATATVVADAVRLIVWGRRWHELVELIGRFAGRPSAAEIRRILRENRAAIEKSADKERSKKKK
ncbi:MAG TPA: hypothetical protein VE046_16815 [Steroidobacteraceae bacterium]|nr:hypothetical protein [Steroidobacteraceae bacterium]